MQLHNIPRSLALDAQFQHSALLCLFLDYTCRCRRSLCSLSLSNLLLTFSLLSECHGIISALNFRARVQFSTQFPCSVSLWFIQLHSLPLEHCKSSFGTQVSALNFGVQFRRSVSALEFLCSISALSFSMVHSTLFVTTRTLQIEFRHSVSALSFGASMIHSIL